MTIELPSELTWALSFIGIDFPDADEDKLEEMGQVWLSFADTLKELIAEVDRPAQAVWTGNRGLAIKAFKDSWTGTEAPLANLRDGAEAAAMVAAGLSTAATIVVALKLLVIAEVASFVVTCVAAALAAKTGVGAILGVAGVVARRAIAQLVIGWAFDLAIEKLLNG